MPNKVINLKKATREQINSALYIGRPSKGSADELNNTHFGNPFSHLADSAAIIRVVTRYDSIIAYKNWLNGTDHVDVEQDRRAWILANLHRVKNARFLACFCAPLCCHGDILEDLVK